MKTDYELERIAEDVGISISFSLSGKIDKRKRYSHALMELTNELYGFSRSWREPKINVMFTELFWPEMEGQGYKTVEDVSLQTWLLAKELETIANADRKKQELLKDACFELSRQFYRYSQAFRHGLVA